MCALILNMSGASSAPHDHAHMDGLGKEVAYCLVMEVSVQLQS